MALRIVRLGSPRLPGEGLRLGTVRRPPRGVPKDDWARRDFFDLFFPNLAPSESLLRGSPGEGPGPWRTFRRRFLAELKRPEARRDLELVAALSRRTELSIGCYCADESRCHRGILRERLLALGAEIRD